MPLLGDLDLPLGSDRSLETSVLVLLLLLDLLLLLEADLPLLLLLDPGGCADLLLLLCLSRIVPTVVCPPVYDIVWV